MTEARTPAISERAVDQQGRLTTSFHTFLRRLWLRTGGTTDLAANVAATDVLVGALSDGFSAERVVTDTTTITWDIGTAGQAKADAIGVEDGSGNLVLVSEATGVEVRDTSGSDPVLRLAGDAGADLAKFAVVSGAAYVDNETNSGTINLRTRDSGGTMDTVLSGSADGPATLYFTDLEAFRTQADGAMVSDTSGSAPKLQLATDAQAELGNLNHSGTVLKLLNKVDGGAVQLSGEVATDSEKAVFYGDPAGSGILYYAGTEAAKTIAEGFRITDTSGDQVQLQAYADDLTSMHWRIADLGSAMYLENNVYGESVVIRGRETGTGDYHSMFNADPDGAVILYYQGTEAFKTLADGIRISDTSGSIVTLELANDAATRLGYLQHASGALELRNESHGGPINLRTENAATGALRLMLQADPEDGVSIDDPGGAGSVTLESAGTNRVQVNSTGLGFFNVTPVARPDITGARDDPEAALANVITALANLGLVTDSTTAS